LTDRIWAPWRVEYVTNPDKGGCFLCEARDSDDDEQCGVVCRGKDVFIVQNRYPYTSGHLMIAPYRHAGELGEMTPDEMNEIMALLRDSEAVLGEVMSPHGLNCGINLGRVAGAGLVGHLHMHIVPRWDGDTNFMALFADTTVISQGLAEQHKLLAEAFARKRAAS